MRFNKFLEFPLTKPIETIAVRAVSVTYNGNIPVTIKGTDTFTTATVVVTNGLDIPPDQDAYTFTAYTGDSSSVAVVVATIQYSPYTGTVIITRMKPFKGVENLEFTVKIGDD
ncbi:hypothetical protein B0H16DRAFT_1737971 [Mycena metata]|uniref:Uncharacterized protein n=1 Tax=Mycena metata TaxID=1033252 RepID=A0AAD7ML07_9AGAR|nr:hypothetical protein B0H16DRAFT_1737971 [Mycena metata]